MISPNARRGFIDHQTLSLDAYNKFIVDDFLSRGTARSSRRRPLRPPVHGPRKRPHPRRPNGRFRLQPTPPPTDHPSATPSPRPGIPTLTTTRTWVVNAGQKEACRAEHAAGDRGNGDPRHVGHHDPNKPHRGHSRPPRQSRRRLQRGLVQTGLSPPRGRGHPTVQSCPRRCRRSQRQNCFCRMPRLTLLGTSVRDKRREPAAAHVGILRGGRRPAK